MKTSQEFFALRKKLKLSQQEFADKLGISTSSVTSIEVGRMSVSRRIRAAMSLMDEGGELDIEKAVEEYRTALIERQKAKAEMVKAREAFMDARAKVQALHLPHL
jgi:DNA-binding XRE family transcriptional regulator